MIVVDALLLLVLIGGAVFLVMRAVSSSVGRTRELGPGTWRTAHYDAKGATKVVVRKVSANGVNIINEHVVATVRLDDPEYDAHFMAAMATARERRAIFESEDDG